MDATTTEIDLAAAVIAVLRSHKAELRAAGIRHLSLYGSVARNDATVRSDVDLAVDLDPHTPVGLFALAALERRLGELLGKPVDLLPEPTEKQRLQAAIDRDRRIVF